MEELYKMNNFWVSKASVFSNNPHEEPNQTRKKNSNFIFKYPVGTRHGSYIVRQNYALFSNSILEKTETGKVIN